MGIKELKKDFHEQDKKFSSHFHNTDQNGIKKPSWGKIIIAWIMTLIIASIVVGAIFGGSQETNLHLNDVDVILDANETVYTIVGSTDVNATVFISSKELNLDNITIKIDPNGEFRYNVTVPQNVTDVKVSVSSKVTDKLENNSIVNIQRPITFLLLDDVKFTDNDTSLTVSGKTDPNAQVIISSSDLNITSITLTADNKGIFKHIAIPNDKNNFEITVKSQVLGKKVASDIVSVVRKLTPEPVEEVETTTEADTSNPSLSTSDSSDSTQVIITRTGSKYHMYQHGNMKYITYVPLSQAKLSYDPCSICC